MKYFAEMCRMEVRDEGASTIGLWWAVLVVIDFWFLYVYLQEKKKVFYCQAPYKHTTPLIRAPSTWLNFTLSPYFPILSPWGGFQQMHFRRRQIFSMLEDDINTHSQFFLWQIPTSVMLESHGRYMFHFISWHVIFQSKWNIFHFFQQSIMYQFASHQHIVLPAFLF